MVIVLNLEGILFMNNMSYKATIMGNVCAPVLQYLKEAIEKNSER
jgi:hypothetical protein